MSFLFLCIEFLIAICKFTFKRYIHIVHRPIYFQMNVELLTVKKSTSFLVNVIRRTRHGVRPIRQ